MLCPCQSGDGFDECCGRFISQTERPENPEQLMRSRYCAYVLGKQAYLKLTWHANHRPQSVEIDKRIKWLGLEILDRQSGTEQGKVEFEAHYLIEGRVEAMHEASDFICESGQWQYTTGRQLEPSFKPWKPGRNETCPCGSGKKFKRCCG